MNLGPRSHRGEPCSQGSLGSDVVGEPETILVQAKPNNPVPVGSGLAVLHRPAKRAGIHLFLEPDVLLSVPVVGDPVWSAPEKGEADTREIVIAKEGCHRLLARALNDVHFYVEDPIHEWAFRLRRNGVTRSRPVFDRLP